MLYDPARWRPVRRPRAVTRLERASTFAAAPDVVFQFSCDGENLPKILPDPIVPCKGTDELIVQHNHVYMFRQWMGYLVPVRWVVRIAEFVPGVEYVDEQLRGPFVYWRHRHRCDPDGAGGTRYQDTVEFRTLLGPHIDRLAVLPIVSRVFAYRHAKMSELLESEAGRP
jgi:ligand-binding SRPBCC domain-containing protein